MKNELIKIAPKVIEDFEKWFNEQYSEIKWISIEGFYEMGFTFQKGVFETYLQSKNINFSTNKIDNQIFLEIQKENKGKDNVFILGKIYKSSKEAFNNGLKSAFIFLEKEMSEEVEVEVEIQK